MNRKFKLIKELPGLKVDTIIEFDPEYEEIWLEDEVNGYKQPSDGQYYMLLELVSDLIENKESEYLKEILIH